MLASLYSSEKLCHWNVLNTLITSLRATFPQLQILYLSSAPWSTSLALVFIISKNSGNWMRHETLPDSVMKNLNRPIAIQIHLHDEVVELVLCFKVK